MNPLLNQFSLAQGALGGAPKYDLNTAAGLNFLQAGTKTMGDAGDVAQGLWAFLPRAWESYKAPTGVGGDAADSTTTYFDEENSRNAATLANIANQMGYDLNGFNLGSWGQQGMHAPTGGQPQLVAQNAPYMTGSGQPTNNNTLSGLFQTLNDDLKNYAKFNTASAGWDGKNDPRGMSSTMYYQTSPNVWEPVSRPNFYSNPKKGSWAQEEGSELIAAASMIAPAFGGWAGMLGNGTAGTLTAGGGLGLTGGLSSTIGSGLTNALVNAGVQGALNGGISPTSLLSSLGMTAAGSLASGNGLGNMFNTSAPVGPAAAPTTLGQLWNSGIGASIRNSPFFRTEGGGYANQGLAALARLIK